MLHTHIRALAVLAAMVGLSSAAAPKPVLAPHEVAPEPVLAPQGGSADHGVSSMASVRAETVIEAGLLIGEANGALDAVRSKVPTDRKALLAERDRLTAEQAKIAEQLKALEKQYKDWAKPVDDKHTHLIAEANAKAKDLEASQTAQIASHEKELARTLAAAARAHELAMEAKATEYQKAVDANEAEYKAAIDVKAADYKAAVDAANLEFKTNDEQLKSANAKLLESVMSQSKTDIDAQHGVVTSLEAAYSAEKEQFDGPHKSESTPLMETLEELKDQTTRIEKALDDLEDVDKL